jgi:tellurite resistance protein TehA-like permease
MTMRPDAVPSRPLPTWRGRLLAEVADLSPAYFGMVMATGIVSVAAAWLGHRSIAEALFGLNLAAYAVLWLLTGWRIARYPRRLLGDLVDHLRGPGFFTTVAATSVVGTQFALIAGELRVASLLWVVALVLWFGLTYAIFTAFTVKSSKPTLDRGINGAWLLAIVATQSIAVLATLLAAHGQPPWRFALNFVALSMWLWGGMLYVWTMALIFYRYTFFPLSPADLTPPYWINMGAMAISTLAGSLLVANAADAPFLQSLLPFVKGFTVLYWATGTWWIPMLLALGVWRYVCRRHPLRYDPLYWGAVFPLGMYAASTQAMIAAMGLGFLAWLPPAFFYLALAAWAATFLGLVHRVSRRLLPSTSTA